MISQEAFKLNFQWVDLKSYYKPQEVIELLSHCMWPDEEKIVAELENYRKDPNRDMMGYVWNHQLIGLVGIVPVHDKELILRHMAIKPQYRGQGIGKQMIMECRSQYAMPLVAETDKEAVDFYRRVGFQIESLGEKYPGIERFHCTLE
ncbi:GNAT family N-acetyltransferase [Paenibacillus sp. 1001270B_150601_E10]|uniref:GNAT family N-acetyltransferase n=1 Tax=Paenibacillus sp. 1001270B_150601_E10 TaxID=2787079 RepID=UPI00189DB9BE|nr:GNAT family N-acetyltransferase [Paenibacillus sp. 1001270B_150601_E10]